MWTRSQQVPRAREQVGMRSHGGSSYVSWRSPIAPHPVEDEHTIGSGWLERTDPEWACAWSHFPDLVMAHPVSGECLQYTTWKVMSQISDTLKNSCFEIKGLRKQH